VGLLTRRARTWLVAAGAAAIVTAANASEGAYFSQSWGWVALAFLVPVAVALILGVTEAPGFARAAFAVLVAALGVWIVVSATWSVSSSASIREGERMLVYVAVALALALLLRRGDATGVAAGVFAGIVAIAGYALATRLFPGRFDVYDDPFFANRLAEPLGYPNSLGLLIAMGILVGLGWVAAGRTAMEWMCTGAVMPMLVTALYFTFSRGAIAALVIGYLLVLLLDPIRIGYLLATLAIAPTCVLSVVIASRQGALTSTEGSAVDAIGQGHRLAVWILALGLASGVVAIAAGLGLRRVVPSRRTIRVASALVVTAVCVSITGTALALGGPTAVIAEARSSFIAPIALRDPTDLNERLLSLSGSGRSEIIEVAWDAAQERPLLGHGAGSFEYLWYERRASLRVIRDAHSLYLETLVEAGVPGAMLVLAVLCVPVVAAARSRRSRLVPAAAGAYVAWGVHSAIDWHWEMVGVTMTAFLVGGVGLIASESGARLVSGARWPLLGTSVVLSVAAVVSLVGNQALFAGREAVLRTEWASAVDHARRAERLLSWSHEPAIVLGDAAAGLGDRKATLEAYRDAVAVNPRSWPAWLRLAQVAGGEERRRAYARVRELNPQQEELPGERRASP
jgi:hypothetical protein